MIDKKVARIVRAEVNAFLAEQPSGKFVRRCVGPVRSCPHQLAISGLDQTRSEGDNRHEVVGEWRTDFAILLGKRAKLIDNIAM